MQHNSPLRPASQSVCHSQSEADSNLRISQDISPVGLLQLIRRLREKKEARSGLPKLFCRAGSYQVNCAPRRMWREICQRFGCPYMPFRTMPADDACALYPVSAAW